MADRARVLKGIVLLLAALYALNRLFCGDVRPPDGVLAPSPPRQEAAPEALRWTIADHQLTALARYEIEARVLGTERYRYDRGAALSPIDFAVGWGPMSANAVLDTLEISQYGRFYFYWTDEAPLIEFSEMGRHAANMHLIPADDTIRSTLLAVRTGQVVTLRGWLVAAHGADGFRWRSSLTRNDTGGGSCELMLVEEISVR
ncbi:hypothetical protein KJ059_08300 [Myxococcota bacterium]|nr:hypothetical protein [Myxococcota bacterium]MCZ7619924.1 hypothetical protein [Myxococcota bacterium]